MQNDYSNKGQAQTTADKASEFARSTGQDVQNQFKQVQEQAGQVMTTLDKQVRENPWPVIAGVAIGAFLFGCLISKSNK